MAMSAFPLDGHFRILGVLALVLVLALFWVRPAGERGVAPEAVPARETIPPPGSDRGNREAKRQEADRWQRLPPRTSAADAARLDREAMNAWRTGDIRTAMELFEQAVAAAPDDPAPHSHYGRLLTLMVSYERAIPLLERARDLAPRDAQAWLDLATVYERAQRFDDAWAARTEAEKLVGAHAVTRDEQGRFIVVGNEL